MIRKDLLIRKTRTLLGEFVRPRLEQVDKPRQRFLQQAIRGILFCGFGSAAMRRCVDSLSWRCLR